MDGEMKKIIKEAKKRGWYLHRTGKHYIYKHERGGAVTVSKSASTKGAFQAVKRDFNNEERKWEILEEDNGEKN